MNQIDFVGDLPEAPQRAPVSRNPRPSVEEEKASLRRALKELCNKCPESVRSGSIQTTHAWLKSQEQGLKVVNNARASVPMLTAALANMRRWR